MKKNIWQKRIPTSAALFVLLIGVFFTSYLIQKGIIFIGHASPEKTPQKVSITNISDKSFVVSFTSTDTSAAAISVDGPNLTPTTFFDDRNKTNSQASFYSHLITVTGLSPNTTYEFSILSDGETYLDTNGKKYVATTGPTINGPSTNPNIISGNVIMPDGSTASDAITKLTVNGTQTLAVLTDNNGVYKIDVSQIRSNDLKTFVSLNSSSQITLDFIKQDLSSTTKVLLSDASTIPTTTLSYQYDFTQNTSPTNSTSSSLLKTPDVGTSNGEVNITSPDDNQSLVDDKPEIQGTALPSKSVKLLLDSNQFGATVSDTRGFWTFRPSSGISVGQHTLTVQSPDSVGIMKSATISFSVFSSGTQIAQTATPSATIIPTLNPTATPTLVPTITLASPTPPLILTPTVIPTVTITPDTPTPTLVIKPTAVPTIGLNSTPAPTGSSSSAFIGAISVILITGGAALLFLL
ncbi:MAG TPA: Ig-like domain-containing protein [Patescibacteria group bacterium]|nr:Ig-like domain-containing protein [Patescibacteria group bacterium]